MSLPAGSATDPNGPPLHGYRGELTPPPGAARPQGFTIALSREVGSRGGTIATAVGRLLGWQVFTQEMLEYLTADETAQQEFRNELSPDARLWADVEYARLLHGHRLKESSATATIARLVLALAARGETVLVGRGAGYILPPATTVHARVVAPLDQRIAYFTQWQRLTEDEAAAHVNALDHRRSEFLTAVSGRNPADANAFDVVLNSARLGLDGAAELIVQALRVKQNATANRPPSDADLRI